MTDRTNVVSPWGKLAILMLLAVVSAAALAIPSRADAARNGPILFSDYTNIWKIQPDGSKLKKVARRAAWSLDASPNGKTLAYTHDGLFTMPIKGGARPTCSGAIQSSPGSPVSTGPPGRRTASASSSPAKMTAAST